MKSLKTLASLLCTLALLTPAFQLQAQTNLTVLHSFGIFTNLTGFYPQASLVQGPDGTLYGTAASAEGAVGGTVYKIQPDGSGFAVLKYFTNFFEGAGPQGGVTLSGNVLYGAGSGGGSFSNGVIYKLNIDGSGFTTLYNFTGGTDGGVPLGSLVVSNGFMYGGTFRNGVGDHGVVFKVKTDGTGFAVLHNFSGGTDGAGPYGGLTLSGGVLYGAANGGATANFGALFKVGIDGSGFTTLHDFAGEEGAIPYGALVVSGTTLYGTCASYGKNPTQNIDDQNGSVFKMNTDGSGFTALHIFSGNADGGAPVNLVLSGSTLYGTTGDGGSQGNGLVYKINTDGSGFAPVYDFINSDKGKNPSGLSLFNGVLYGTATGGGTNYNDGTLFKLNLDGSAFQTLFVFKFSDAAYPYADLLAYGNALYGTTSGGDYGSGDITSLGAIIKVNLDGTGYTSLHVFTGGIDGGTPYAGLIAVDGVLYGTTSTGGASGQGTVFKVNLDGTGFTTLYSFTGGTDGGQPYTGVVFAGGNLYGAMAYSGANGTGFIYKISTNGTGFGPVYTFSSGSSDPDTGMVINNDGSAPGSLIISGTTLFGATASGGASGSGTVFKVNVDGTGFVTLHSFGAGVADPDTGATLNADGIAPGSGLTQSGNMLYGTANYGGTEGGGTVFQVRTDGTGFATLYDFTGGNDGGYPQADLALSGGLLTGMTAYGGEEGMGAIFQVSTNGANFTVLHSFTGGSDGSYPQGGLISSGGVLYGAASGGGIVGDGILFSLGSVTIAPASVTLSNLAQTYDGTVKNVSATTVPTNLLVTLTYNSLTNAPTNAGSYTVIGTISDPNYYGSATNTLVISPALSPVSFSGLNQTYDATAKPVTVVTIPAGLTVNITYNGSSNPPTNAGNYAVTATVNDQNYTGSATNTLIVSPALATVSFSGLNQAYDATAKIVSALTSPAGLPVTVTYNGATTAPTNPGSYLVVGMINSTNYYGNVTNTFVISQTVATVLLGGLNQTYDGTAKPVTISTTPANLVVAVTYDASPNAPTNAGSYTVVATITDPYHAGASTNTLVIAQAPQTITFTPLSDAVLDDAPLTLTATASSGLPVSFVSSVPSVATVSNNVVFLLALGSTTLTASQPGNANFLAATNATQILVVQPFLLNLAIQPGPLTNGAASTAVLVVTGNTNRVYSIIYSEDLATNYWPVLLTTNLPAVTNFIVVPVDRPYRFYRLVRGVWTP